MDRPVTLLGEASYETLKVLARQSPQGGAFAEVGVYRGGAAWGLAEIARERQVSLHLYDTFTGIPYASPEQGDSHRPGDFSDTSLEEVRRAIPDAYYHVGIFPDTLYPMGPVAFVHCDCDQYAAVRAVCEVMHPLMMAGGIIVFDDYGSLAGATRAVEEFYRITEVTPQGKAVVRIGTTVSLRAH